MIKIKNRINDIDLIDSYIAGDNNAMDVLLKKYREKIYNYILMLVKDKYIADDIYQDVFIKISAFLKEGRYKDDGRFVHWALRISHNKTIDYFRLQKNQREISTDQEGNENLADKVVLEGNIENEMINTQVKTDVRKLVESLPIEQREVVIMRHYLDLSFKEIADQTGVSINTALGRMRYALINLRKMIDDNQITFEIA